MSDEKEIAWIGSSYKDLLEFPSQVRHEAGYQLHRIQNGFDPEDWKPFQTIGVGVKEIRLSDDGNAFRIIYVAKFLNRIYVLHSFKKKTQKTSKKDITISKIRYKALFELEKS